MNPRKVGNLSLFEVSGSAYEIGFKHGTAFKDQIQKGVIPYLAQFLNRTIDRSDLPVFRKPLLAYLHHRYGRHLLVNMPERHLSLLDGLSKGAGLPVQMLRDAAVFPDLFLALVATAEKIQRAPFVSPVTMGCTSAIAARSATQDGKLYHARNFDYPAAGHWDSNRVISFCTPDDGMPFLEVHSAGVPVAGITGLNAAGISICMHQHWVDRIDPRGVAAGIAGDEVLRKATTLDEAIEIVLSYPPASGWTYMLSDGDRKQAVALEVAPGGHGIIKLGETGTPDTLAYSNVYLSQALGGREYALSEHYWKNCLWRLERTRGLLKADYSRHTPQTLAAILGDSCTPEGTRGCLLGSMIVTPITVTSVVLDPGARALWVGDGASPAPHREFVPFSLTEKDLVLTAPRFTVGGFGSPQADAAMGDYSAAYRAFFEDGDANAAWSHLSRATEKHASASELWLMRGILALRAGKADDALASMRRALSGRLEEPSLSDAKVALAFALDLQASGRGEARALYREVASHAQASKKARQLATRGAFLRFTPRRARNLSIDFVYGGLG